MSKLFSRSLVVVVASQLLVACAPGAEPEAPPSATESLTLCAPGASVEGVDVSDANGAIDWSAARGAGVRFAWMKATQGTYNTNATFAGNWRGTHAAGVVRGAYHFFDPTEDGVAQARHFLATVGTLAVGDLPPMLDLECPDGDTYCLGSGFVDATGDAPGSSIRQRALDWLRTVEAATGRTPVVYTFGAYFAGAGFDTTGLGRYPLFVAAPGTTGCFSVPSPWTAAAMYQYSWDGSVPGIDGSVDRDRFAGTLAQLEALGSGGTAPPAPSGAWSCGDSDYEGQQYWTCSGSARVRCDGAGRVEREACQFGCDGRAAGTDDYCRSAGWTCDRSDYEGRQYWTCFNGEVLRCVDADVPVKVHCAHGCTLGPVGTDDHCD